MVASARYVSEMTGGGALFTDGVAGGAAGGVTTAGGATGAGGGGGGGGGGVTAGGGGGATGGGGGCGASQCSVTVGIDPPLQVAPTVTVPKTGHVWVDTTCALTGNVSTTPFTVSVETLPGRSWRCT